MKKQIYILAAILFLTLAAPVVKANDNKSKPEITASQIARAEVIHKRVEEIRDLDKSQLSREERKQLRNELQELKREVKSMGGGIYLSVGAIIIILLVLILIL
ncbi:hypothetical protein [Daejeonella sp. H1SJ63]|jgi:Flp pilus assembly protein TadB|uniref:hypothetical protein n=1 Tax=Daejeonella sp. H1SJ63 TaxID=3034145 RepID=UPI0023ED4913|nr:hypothetical protein [Daejeonella sp. H1SJ63]